MRSTGAVLNPLSGMLTTDALGYTVTDVGARIVIGSSDKAGQLRVLKASGALDHMVLWGTDEAEDATLLPDWLSRYSAEFSVRPRQPSDLAVIAYTSGTTGSPKSAMQSQRAAALSDASQAASQPGLRLAGLSPTTAQPACPSAQACRDAAFPRAPGPAGR